MDEFLISLSDFENEAQQLSQLFERCVLGDVRECLLCFSRRKDCSTIEETEYRVLQRLHQIKGGKFN